MSCGITRGVATVLMACAFAVQNVNAQEEPTSPTCSVQEAKDWVIQNGIYSQLTTDYPPFARALGQQGRLVVGISTDAEGRVVGARVVRSSGLKELDEGVIEELANKKYGTNLVLPACAPAGKGFSFTIPLYYKFQEAMSAAKRELVIEYFKTTNSWDSITVVAPRITHILFNALRQRYPNASPETLDVISEEVKAVLKKEMGEGSPYAERLIELHQQYFTEEDIRRLILFHRTPLGRKLTNVMPGLLVEAASMGERMGEGVMLLIVDRANARLKGRGYPYMLAPPKKPSTDANQDMNQAPSFRRL